MSYVHPLHPEPLAPPCILPQKTSYGDPERSETTLPVLCPEKPVRSSSSGPE